VQYRKTLRTSGKKKIQEAMLREQDGWAVEGAMVRERDAERTTAQHPDAQLIMLLSPFFTHVWLGVDISSSVVYTATTRAALATPHVASPDCVKPYQLRGSRVMSATVLRKNACQTDGNRANQSREAEPGCAPSADDERRAKARRAGPCTGAHPGELQPCVH
jgi:hypothetical protein